MKRLPGLVLTLIVRNGAATLGRCLASVQDLAEELIVVDTGSQDNSVAVAEAAGARVLHSPWQHDFSAPRNLALAAARGRWALILDADEWLLPAGQRLLPELLDKLPPGPVAVWGAIGPPGGPWLASRALLRLGQGLRFVGRVHETLVWQTPAGEQAPHWIDCPGLEIGHAGAAPRLQAHKDRYYLDLIAAEWATSPPPWRLRELAYHRSEGLRRLGALAEARQALQVAWRAQRACGRDDDFAVHLSVAIVRLAWQQQDLPTAESAAQLVLKLAPERPEGWFYAAYAAFWRGEREPLPSLLAQAQLRGAPPQEIRLLQARCGLLQSQPGVRDQLMELAKTFPQAAVFLHLARACCLEGDLTAARYWYCRARPQRRFDPLQDPAWSPDERAQLQAALGA
ncbi:MAG: glycosyltransferase [Candidatus Sericytochromatia bacterium]